MKKFFVFSMMVLFALATMQVQAQEKEKKVIKEEIKQTKKELKVEKKELSNERKELRKLEKGDVNYQSKEQFYRDFGNLLNVQWKRSDYFDEAMFTKDGQKMTAFYDINSNLVGTTSQKTFEDLPARAQKEIKAKYKDYIVDLVLFFEDNEANDTDILLYGARFSDVDNYFVELLKGNEKIVLQINLEGDVYYFKKL
ncbi:hypothetical protein [uncultured Bacteroides sp.]|uniref:hypothetical protein n=1 Tax=uncultured Bacteroides sp. TaxID=162156 RepID=UPI002AA707B7|nr:hypothetical protein [uncultured Bacteroides sp.]